MRKTLIFYEIINFTGGNHLQNESKRGTPLLVPYFCGETGVWSYGWGGENP